MKRSDPVIRTDLSRPLNFLQAMTLLFIGLKLTGHIDWSWFWVVSPLFGLFLLTMLGWIVARLDTISDSSRNIPSE